MKLELFGPHEQRDIIEIESDPLEIGLEVENISFENSVHISCEIMRNEDVARVYCNTSVPVLLQCARCLDEFTRNVEQKFSLVVRKLRKGETIPEDLKDENSEENMLIYIDQNTNSIDITDFVRDAVMLSIPLKPVCKENCKGLCSVCGYNLNEGECGCTREISDPRWKDLSNLLNS